MSVTRARPSKPSPEEVPGAEGFLPARRTLPTLRAAIPTCRGCTLYKHATQAVFGEGSAASRVMLIGEVPGDREDVLGKPFVGPAGRLLDEALADKMASAGGLGLAEIFKRQLQQMPGASAQTAPLPPTATAALARSAPQHQIAAAAAPLPGALPIASAPPQVGPLLEGAPRFAMPVNGRRSSGYGERVDPIHQARRMHAGFDIAAPTGTHVAAAASGEVVHAGPAGTYGNLVRVRHADGFETRYAHLSRVDVKVGDRV